MAYVSRLPLEGTNVAAVAASCVPYNRVVVGAGRAPLVRRYIVCFQAVVDGDAAGQKVWVIVGPPLNCSGPRFSSNSVTAFWSPVMVPANPAPKVL